MAQKDSGDGPSLELPSLGFRRRRRRGPETPPEPTPETGPATPPDTEALPAFTPAPPLPPTEERSRAEVVLEAPAEEPPAAGPAPRSRRRLPRPRLGGTAAAAVTGLVTGALLVVLVWLSTRVCDVVAGTSSCGDPGLLLLLGVLVVVVVAGRVLLGRLGVPEPGSTSLLAVGTVTAASLLLLTDVLFEPWVVVPVVALSVGAHVLAHRVTTAFVEPSGPEPHR